MHMVDQFPLVAAFAGYVMWSRKQGRAERKEEREQWMEFLRDKNAKSEKVQKEVAEALVKVATQLGENEKILDRIEMRVTPGP